MALSACKDSERSMRLPMFDAPMSYVICTSPFIPSDFHIQKDRGSGSKPTTTKYQIMAVLVDRRR